MKQTRYLKLSVFLLLALSLIFTSCARYRDVPPGTVKEIRGPGFESVGMKDLPKTNSTSGQNTDSSIVEAQIVTVLPLAEPPPSPEYIVGPFDVLNINVSGKPEFSSMGSTAEIGRAHV